MISGLSHITLIVRDLRRTAALLECALDAERVYASGDRSFSLSEEMFFLVGGVWVCIMQGEPPERSYNHVAFQIPDACYDLYLARLGEAGVEIRPGRPRVEGEGRSIYFYDYDNHLFELHTGSLAERLRRYAQMATPHRGQMR